MVLLLQPLVALHTGSFFALIGGFALVALLPRLKAAPEELRENLPPVSGLRLSPGIAAAGLLALLWAALCLGRTPEGWSLAFAEMLPWRLPRVLAAIAAGAAFGLAGVLLQRAMANPMAGPEILGVSGGAALGLILAVALGGATGRAELFLATSAGAGLALAALLALTARSGFSPRRLLLLGLGVATLISALLSGLLASGHPLAGRLLIWLAGPTDRATLEGALLALGLTVGLLALTPFLRRGLEILPLGSENAEDRGFRLEGVVVAAGGRRILEAASLKLAPGRVCGVIGRNGAGKSTLLRVLAGSLRPARGQVLLNGRPLAGLSGRGLAREIAAMPQSLPPAEGLTARELAALGRYPWHGALGPETEADRSRVSAALERVGLADRAERLVSSLSGGERQRAWLAVMIAQEAGWFVLDEPAATLDLCWAAELLALLRRLAHEEGRGVVATLHDLSLAARWCDDLIVLKAGRVLAAGPLAESLQPEILSEAFGLVLGVSSHEGGPIVWAI